MTLKIPLGSMYGTCIYLHEDLIFMAFHIYRSSHGSYGNIVIFSEKMVISNKGFTNSQNFRGTILFNGRLP